MGELLEGLILSIAIGGAATLGLGVAYLAGYDSGAKAKAPVQDDHSARMRSADRCSISRYGLAPCDYNRVKMVGSGGKFL